MDINLNEVKVTEFWGDIPRFLKILKAYPKDLGIVIQSENDFLVLMFGLDEFFKICFTREGKFVGLSKNDAKIAINSTKNIKDLLNITIKNDLSKLEQVHKEDSSSSSEPKTVELYSKKAALQFLEDYLEEK